MCRRIEGRGVTSDASHARWRRARRRGRLYPDQLHARVVIRRYVDRPRDLCRCRLTLNRRRAAGLLSARKTRNEG